jgi:phosphatidylglycerophosphate synthase
VPVALRLVRGAARAGAAELVLLGPVETRDAIGALVRRDPSLSVVAVFMGAAPPATCPVVEARAELSVPGEVWRALALAAAPRVVLEAQAIVRPVRTEREARAATRAIFRGLARDRAAVGIARANGYLSRPITRALVGTAATPGQLTAVHTAIGLVSAWLFAFGGEGALLAAGLCFDGASILDGVDGELARARLADSEAGAWIDTLGDDLVYLAFALALPIGYARSAVERGLAWAPWVGFFGAALWVGATVLIFGMARFALDHRLGGSMSRVTDALAPSAGSGPLRAVRRGLLALGRRACFARVIAVVCALTAITGVRAFYDALFFATTGVVVALAAGFLRATAASSKRLRMDSVAPTVRLGREGSGPHRAGRGTP